MLLREKLQGSLSPAILYISGIINRSPWLAVYVDVSAPAASDPWTAPAAPASCCISVTETGFPYKFNLPFAAHLSINSGIGEDGVIGYIAETSLKA